MSPGSYQGTLLLLRRCEAFSFTVAVLLFLDFFTTVLLVVAVACNNETVLIEVIFFFGDLYLSGVSFIVGFGYSFLDGVGLVERRQVRFGLGVHAGRFVCPVGPVLPAVMGNFWTGSRVSIGTVGLVDGRTFFLLV